MHQNNRQHFLLLNFVKNEAESQAVFAVSYVRNVRGRAMLPDGCVRLPEWTELPEWATGMDFYMWLLMHFICAK